MRSATLWVACAGGVAVAMAHGAGGGAHQKPVVEVDPDADWATRHMQSK